MTIDHVKKQIFEIQKAHDDPELAHAIEDELYMTLLESIAEETCENIIECAKLALTTQNIKFPRWCA